jgi:alpha-tubulin suppressor-like RCC1 family protein
MKTEGLLLSLVLSAFALSISGCATSSVAARESHEKPTPAHIRAIAAGLDFTLLVDSDGSLWACGDNDHGQLGDGTTVARPRPVMIVPAGALMTAAGSGHTLSVTIDARLRACGNNAFGQLGTGDFSETRLLRDVMTDVTSVSAGFNFSMILKSGGSPNHSMILKKGGSLWACGYNGDGQLGDGTFEDRNAPVRVMNDVACVAAGGNHTKILRTDGSLWACGQNLHGQLGGASSKDQSTPVMILPRR